MIVLGIDPGPDRSGAVEFDGEKVLSAQYLDNDDIRRELHDIGPSARPAIEFPEARGGGVPVSQAILDTAAWAGRFDADCTAMLFKPREIRIHFCGVSSCTRAHVNQVLLDRLGPVGTKKQPGPLYAIARPAEKGISQHLWDALAVAVMASDKLRESAREMGAK